MRQTMNYNPKPIPAEDRTWFEHWFSAKYLYNAHNPV